MFCRPAKPPPRRAISQHRRMWLGCHRYMGAGLPVAAAVNAFLGLTVGLPFNYAYVSILADGALLFPVISSRVHPLLLWES